MAKPVRKKPFHNLTPVKKELLTDWGEFFIAPHDLDLTCWLCGRAAAYVTPDKRKPHGLRPWCERHARDF